MRKAAGLVLASLFGVSTASLLGCLPTFDPRSDPQASAGPSDGGGSGGAGGGAGATSGSDLGTEAGGDMIAVASDLGGGGDLAVVCDPVQSTAGLSSPNGHHNAGQDCQGCHAGGGAPTFSIGGTLYNAVTGGAAVAGATINVTDANGKSVKIVSATNGNFWSTTTLAYPVKVNASLCPNTTPMSATVPSNGACNNCHNSTFRVHVP